MVDVPGAVPCHHFFFELSKSRKQLQSTYGNGMSLFGLTIYLIQFYHYVFINHCLLFNVNRFYQKTNYLKLLEYLKEQEQKGLLLFGHHVSKESIMTCFIENRNNKHIHFIDGANGGYTEAAKELKPKLMS
jgi:hypothetical protein